MILKLLFQEKLPSWAQSPITNFTTRFAETTNSSFDANSPGVYFPGQERERDRESEKERTEWIDTARKRKMALIWDLEGFLFCFLALLSYIVKNEVKVVFRDRKSLPAGEHSLALLKRKVGFLLSFMWPWTRNVTFFSPETPMCRMQLIISALAV